ncbi:MFS transporter [Saccharophagus degradans]|uniref:AmpG family muropeptide MFS transporter n=1 Tax=Saccharophagus degradans TaxID=86304 RepID=UPI001C08B750|nr:MFS transporter [Saccharophagus degradans]MBU2984492.1 MFS transporter [Saccharophagus degradans]
MHNRTFSDTLLLYANRRVASIFVLGIASGLPWVIIGSSLTLWLKEAGISRSEIGFAGLIFTAYAANFLWSPLVDQLKIPALQKLGQRKSWLLACQLVLVGSCVLMSLCDPASNAKQLVLFGLMVAMASATQDIAIDAYRVDSFAPQEREYISAAAGAATAGWWTGYAGLGYIPLMLSDLNWSWPELFLLLAAMCAAACAIAMFGPKPQYSGNANQQELYSGYLNKVSHCNQSNKLQLTAYLLLPFLAIAWTVAGSPGLPASITDSPRYIWLSVCVIVTLITTAGIKVAALDKGATQQLQPSALDKPLAWLLLSLAAPLRDFVMRNGLQVACAIFSFILLFKVGEAFLGRMSIVFYKEVGFSNTDIANYSKMLTWVVTIVCSLAGGIVNAHFGLIRGLVVSGCAMALTNLMFAWIALAGPEIPLYVATIILDGFAQAWSTVAFASFIALLCNHNFSATQYALLVSIGNLGRTTLSSFSGQAVDWLNGNWPLFFVLTTLMVIPSLLILRWLSRNLPDVGQHGSRASSKGA